MKKPSARGPWWKRGLDWVLTGLAHRTGFHVVRILANEHSGEAFTGADRLGPNVTCTVLDERSLERLAQDTDMDLSREWVEDACRRGDRCFAVLIDDRAVAYDWRALASPTPMTDALVVHFDDTESCYGFKMFTHPDFRGHRLQQANFAHSDDALAAQGIRRTLGYIEFTNRGSLKVAQASGGHQVGWIAYWVTSFGFVRIRSSGARSVGFDIRRPSKDRAFAKRQNTLQTDDDTGS